jgi:hypothetical protein
VDSFSRRAQLPVLVSEMFSLFIYFNQLLNWCAIIRNSSCDSGDRAALSGRITF